MKIFLTALLAVTISCTALADDKVPTTNQIEQLQEKVTSMAIAESKACPSLGQGLQETDANEAVNCAIARHAHQEAEDNLAWAKRVRDANPGEARP